MGNLNLETKPATIQLQPQLLRPQILVDPSLHAPQQRPEAERMVVAAAAVEVINRPRRYGE
jgi:hypothetical protein